MDQMADETNPRADVKDNRGVNSAEGTATWVRGVDCAGIVLSCLFCRFYDMIHMLPEGLTNHCCPDYKQVVSSVESTPSTDEDFCTDLDCGLLSSCRDASDCLELAMEVSEICYH
ncbi:myoD family inhibitor domain-containing protein 2 [Parambassis ranga]|uniref:MyoD family inhibitor domain-containing protein 2 n=1 Tax=Parambassis ranga TaxID=210632 RepID=A0A6P7IQW0_9TELE|nr:myoD family inhibitor domain-containing protein 2 [Parambassis ranga]